MNMDIVCFSHLRWNFVFQRPQHLLSRLAVNHRVFYFEEPIYDGKEFLDIPTSKENVTIITPHLACEPGTDKCLTAQREVIEEVWRQYNIEDYALWYYTPMALPYSRHLSPCVTVYDCMDELSAFKFAPPAMQELEAELFAKADVVFTGGHTLYQHKKNLHDNIHPFPSSIEKEHFSTARNITGEPADQGSIPNPRIGFFGVVDERFDIGLIEEVATKRPDWQIVLIGPVVKIDPATLPRNPNIHYLGQKSYKELPEYLSGWDIAMIPFALNESTRFISPTKTPEYLAAGVPVISTAINDVIKPYGENGLVHIIHNATEFIEAAETELATDQKAQWLQSVDEFLKDNSWDNTCAAMQELMQQKVTQY